jgi:hypothetical protein
MPVNLVGYILSDTDLTLNTDYIYEVIDGRVFVKFINPNKEYNIQFTQSTLIDVLVVGGGGSGGGTDSRDGGGGGGGGGGVLALDNISANANTIYNIKVGADYFTGPIYPSTSKFDNHIVHPGLLGGSKIFILQAKGGSSGNLDASGVIPIAGGSESYIYIDNLTKTWGGGGGGGAGGVGGNSLIEPEIKACIGGDRGPGKRWDKDNRFYGVGGPGACGRILVLYNIVYTTMDIDYIGEQYGVGGWGGSFGYKKKGFNASQNDIYNTVLGTHPNQYVQGGLGHSGVVIISYMLPPPTLSDFPNLASSYGGVSFNLTNPISNSTGIFSFTSSKPEVAIISGRTVTIIGSGTTTITATQDASGNFSEGIIDASLNVAQANPTITNFPTINKTYGDASFNLTNPNSNSSGAFNYISNNEAIATILGHTVTIVGSGNTTIRATQDASGNYLRGTKDASLHVAPANPTITNFPTINKTYGDIPFDLNASSNSSVAFNYISNNEAIATILGHTVTIVGVGNTTITATQPESGNYLSGSLDINLNVAKGEPTISFLINLNTNLSDGTFTLVPSSNSIGNFSFTSSYPLVATISGNIVTMLTAGTATIRATQEESNLYLGKFIDTSFTVVDTSFTVVETPAISSSSVTLGDTKVTVFTFGEGSVLVVPERKNVNPFSTVTSIRVGTTIYTVMT